MRRKIHQRLKSLTSFKETPHRLALAFGMGILLGILPGTGVLAAAFCSTVFRLNLPLILAGALMTNPLTVPLVYLPSFFIGQRLLGEWLPAGTVPRLLVGTVTGNLILAVSLAMAGYILCFGAVTFLRARRLAGQQSKS